MWGHSLAGLHVHEYGLLQTYSREGSGVGLFHVCTLQLLEMVQLPSRGGLVDPADRDVLGDSY